MGSVKKLLYNVIESVIYFSKKTLIFSLTIRYTLRKVMLN